MRMALSPKGSEPVTDHNVESKIIAQPKIIAQISVEAESPKVPFKNQTPVAERENDTKQ